MEELVEQAPRPHPSSILRGRNPPWGNSSGAKGVPSLGARRLCIRETAAPPGPDGWEGCGAKGWEGRRGALGWPRGPGAGAGAVGGNRGRKETDEVCVGYPEPLSF